MPDLIVSQYGCSTGYFPVAAGTGASAAMPIGSADKKVRLSIRSAKVFFTGAGVKVRLRDSSRLAQGCRRDESQLSYERMLPLSAMEIPRKIWN
jgi:hypothetical protein